MRKIYFWLQENLSNIFRILIFTISVLLIVQLFPRQSGFIWDYSQARPWLYEDLIAPFNFAILKTPEELAVERKEVLEEFIPFFKIDQTISVRQEQQAQSIFLRSWEEKYNDQNQENRNRNLNLITSILNRIYNRGVIFLEENMSEATTDDEILIIEGSIAQPARINDFFTIQSAIRYITDTLQMIPGNNIDISLVRNTLESSLTHSVYWDEETNRKAMASALENISPSRGMVQQGEKIVSKGEIITAEKMRILNSFRVEYSRQLGGISGNKYIYWGQFLLVSVSIIVLFLFLKAFRIDVFNNSRKILVILLSIYLMVFITSQAVRLDINLLYLIPVSIVPIIIRSFFDTRLALFVHLISIVLIGFLVPRSFDFVFIQFIAGIVVILSLVSFRRRSQLFVTVVLIFVTYSAVFTGLSLAETGSFSLIQPVNYLYFAGSALLTLFAYPLIFIFERTSGLNTDFSLLELSDTNSPLLRQLNMSAPGTFQHSLQVANLSEEAINIIGGNSLLVRTGALYHDIGKMDQPHYFIENQNADINPHDELSYSESAEIIIGHVLHGIEKARKHGLPEYLIDFIRTHHGTTTTRYFHIMEQKVNPDKEINSNAFTYKGPKPFNKETAVLMMADSVEAASRSMKNPNEETINKLVDDIIDTQLRENQFDNANITLKDISTIKRVFKNRLMHIFHVRIAYPTVY
jgi:cyclic-di-AMP phosphodiesterase PgpH